MNCPGGVNVSREIWSSSAPVKGGGIPDLGGSQRWYQFGPLDYEASKVVEKSKVCEELIDGYLTARQYQDLDLSGDSQDLREAGNCQFGVVKTNA